MMIQLMKKMNLKRSNLFDKYIKLKLERDGEKKVILRRIGSLRQERGLALKDDIVLIELEKFNGAFLYNFLVYEPRMAKFFILEGNAFKNEKALSKYLRQIKFTNEDFLEDFDHTKELDLEELIYKQNNSL